MNLEEASQEKSFTLAMRVFSPHGEQGAAGSGPGLCAEQSQCARCGMLNNAVPFSLPAGDMVSCSLPALKPNTSRMSGELAPEAMCRFCGFLLWVAMPAPRLRAPPNTHASCLVLCCSLGHPRHRDYPNQHGPLVS